jgi:hypothetical protein
MTDYSDLSWGPHHHKLAPFYVIPSEIGKELKHITAQLFFFLLTPEHLTTSTHEKLDISMGFCNEYFLPNKSTPYWLEAYHVEVRK